MSEVETISWHISMILSPTYFDTPEVPNPTEQTSLSVHSRKPLRQEGIFSGSSNTSRSEYTFAR